MLNQPDAVILCGGAGLRLRSITGDLPKPMVRVAGRPFLELLLFQLKQHAFARVVLSVGYRHELIRGYFGEKAFGMDLVYSVEATPLGTGGALAQAAAKIKTDTALVMNGDSYSEVDLRRLLLEHRGGNAVATVVVMAENRADAGSVSVDESGRVIAFAEKNGCLNTRYQSAGIYVFNKTLFSSLSHRGKTSLEEELLPEWIASGKQINAFVIFGECTDIGTPERYAKAQESLANVADKVKVLRIEGQS